MRSKEVSVVAARLELGISITLSRGMIHPRKSCVKLGNNVDKRVVDDLESVVDRAHVVTNRDQMQNYLIDETPASVRPEPATDLVLVRPAGAEQVSAVLQLANKHGIPVFPRGGGTGLVAGAIPTRNGIVLSMERMNRVEIDKKNMMAVAEAGVTFGRLLEAANEFALFFPPHPGDENAQLGGLVATNAGGSRAVKYGVMRNHVRGLEVVLPTGEILSLGGRLHKNNVGYAFMHLITKSFSRCHFTIARLRSKTKRPRCGTENRVNLQKANRRTAALSFLRGTTMGPKILFADRRPMSEESMKLLHSAGQVVWAEGDDEADLIRDMKDAEIVISGLRYISRKSILAAEKLKGIIAYGVGYDHIDVAAATERRVYVVNTPGVNSISVAEFAFGLMMGAARKIPRLDSAVKAGKWLRWEMLGNELYGKKVGLVGFGRIGAHLATLGKGFSMSVLVYDPYVAKEKAGELGVQLVDLESLLRQSDFVVICCALTDETRGLIGEKALGLMKATAYLINVARGPIVDEQALIKALREKRIAGAGLDVFEKEPPDSSNPLLKFDNIVASSHMAGLSVESTQRLQLVVAEEALRMLKGQEPRFLVNRQLARVE